MQHTGRPLRREKRQPIAYKRRQFRPEFSLNRRREDQRFGKSQLKYGREFYPDLLKHTLITNIKEMQKSWVPDR